MKDVADAVAKMGAEQIAEYETSGSVEVEYKAKGSSDVQRETLQAGEVQVSNFFNLCSTSSHKSLLPFPFSLGHVIMLKLQTIGTVHHTAWLCSSIACVKATCT